MFRQRDSFPCGNLPLHWRRSRPRDESTETVRTHQTARDAFCRRKKFSVLVHPKGSRCCTAPGPYGRPETLPVSTRSFPSTTGAAIRSRCAKTILRNLRLARKKERGLPAKQSNLVFCPKWQGSTLPNLLCLRYALQTNSARTIRLRENSAAPLAPRALPPLSAQIFLQQTLRAEFPQSLWQQHRFFSWSPASRQHLPRQSKR